MQSRKIFFYYKIIDINEIYNGDVVRFFKHSRRNDNSIFFRRVDANFITKHAGYFQLSNEAVG